MSIKKVGDYGANPLGLTRTGQAVATTQQEENLQKAKAPGGTGDTVSLSDAGKLKAQALSTAMASPEVRAERVASLRSQVENGTYRPDATKTAEGMIKDGLNLYG